MYIRVEYKQLRRFINIEDIKTLTFRTFIKKGEI